MRHIEVDKGNASMKMQIEMSVNGKGMSHQKESLTLSEKKFFFSFLNFEIIAIIIFHSEEEKKLFMSISCKFILKTFPANFRSA